MRFKYVVTTIHETGVLPLGIFTNKRKAVKVIRDEFNCTMTYCVWRMDIYEAGRITPTFTEEYGAEAFLIDKSKSGRFRKVSKYSAFPTRTMDAYIEHVKRYKLFDEKTDS